MRVHSLSTAWSSVPVRAVRVLRFACDCSAACGRRVIKEKRAAELTRHKGSKLVSLQIECRTDIAE
jgi:hypothetical protein